MADFDSLWDDDMDIDVSSLDATTNISDKVSNAVSSTTKDQKSQLDKNAEYIDGDDWDNLTCEEQDDRLISTIEKTNKERFANSLDNLNTKKDYLMDKLRDAKDTNAPTKSLVAQLKQLKNEYMELFKKKASAEYQTDLTKARSLGLLAPEGDLDYYVDPKILKQKLDSGNYKYTSTKF